MIGLHVDDFFFCSHELEFETLTNDLKTLWPDIRLDIGDVLSYTGVTLTFDRTNHSVKLTQRHYTDQILEEAKVTDTASTPSTHALYKRDPSSPRVSHRHFAGLVMKIMHLAKRSRPDLLFTASYLATLSHKATEHDLRLLSRVFSYVNGTRDLGLTFSFTGVCVSIFPDASFATHDDGRSQTGVVASYGPNAGSVYTSSSKQTVVALSSTEAEMEAAKTGGTTGEYMINLIDELGVSSTDTPVLYQDNLSTVQLLKTGRGNFKRTKHLNLKFHYIHSLIENGVMKIQHLRSPHVPSNILTKVVTGPAFPYERSLILNCI
jgi:hypothetical protein